MMIFYKVQMEFDWGLVSSNCIFIRFEEEDFSVFPVIGFLFYYQHWPVIGSLSGASRLSLCLRLVLVVIFSPKDAVQIDLVCWGTLGVLIE